MCSRKYEMDERLIRDKEMSETGVAKINEAFLAHGSTSNS